MHQGDTRPARSSLGSRNADHHRGKHWLRPLIGSPVCSIGHSDQRSRWRGELETRLARVALMHDQRNLPFRRLHHAVSRPPPWASSCRGRKGIQARLSADSVVERLLVGLAHPAGVRAPWTAVKRPWPRRMRQHAGGSTVRWSPAGSGCWSPGGCRSRSSRRCGGERRSDIDLIQDLEHQRVGGLSLFVDVDGQVGP